MITAGVAGALERAEIENLADMFNKGEYSQFLKEYENYEAAALSAPDQLKLCSLFLEAHFVKPKEIPLSKVESFYRRGTQQLRSSEEFAYAYGEFNMRLLAAKGEYQAAAAEAGRLKKEWGEKLNRVLPVYAKEPVLLLKAGLKEQAIRLVNETWINNPNNYAINEAVRIELADALYGYGDVQLAFDLLSELRLSYPMEFRSSPYVVQNYYDSAIRIRFLLLWPSSCGWRRMLRCVADSIHIQAISVSTNKGRSARSSMPACWPRRPPAPV